jgi:hypothetical protein
MGLTELQSENLAIKLTEASSGCRTKLNNDTFVKELAEGDIMRLLVANRAFQK